MSIPITRKEAKRNVFFAHGSLLGAIVSFRNSVTILEFLTFLLQPANVGIMSRRSTTHKIKMLAVHDTIGCQ